MKALAVDFRTPNRPPRWAWIGIGALAVVALALLVALSVESRKLSAMVAQREELMRSRTAPVKAPTVLRIPKPYEASAREMLVEATSDWPAMLTALESVAIIGVTPASIEIAPSERRIRVEVEFTDYATLLEYLDQLNAGAAMPRWTLMQAQASARGSNSTPQSAPALASIQAQW